MVSAKKQPKKIKLIPGCHNTWELSNGNTLYIRVDKTQPCDCHVFSNYGDFERNADAVLVDKDGKVNVIC